MRALLQRDLDDAKVPRGRKRKATGDGGGRNKRVRFAVRVCCLVRFHYIFAVWREQAKVQDWAIDWKAELSNGKVVRRCVVVVYVCSVFSVQKLTKRTIPELNVYLIERRLKRGGKKVSWFVCFDGVHQCRCAVGVALIALRNTWVPTNNSGCK